MTRFMAVTEMMSCKVVGLEGVTTSSTAVPVTMRYMAGTALIGFTEKTAMMV
jgi:hypothetical protein